jgi:hypothetical protein
MELSSVEHMDRSGVEGKPWNGVSKVHRIEGREVNGAERSGVKSGFGEKEKGVRRLERKSSGVEGS